MAGRPAGPHKTPVLVMAERRAGGICRCRAVVLDRVDAASLRAALQNNIELGSTIRSDGPLVLHQSMDGFVHDRVSARDADDPPHLLFPAVSRVQSQIKRWLEGTLQGAAQPEHLQDYLHESEFRFNRRTASKPGLLFYRLLEQAVRTPSWIPRHRDWRHPTPRYTTPAAGRPTRTARNPCTTRCRTPRRTVSR